MLRVGPVDLGVASLERPEVARLCAATATARPAEDEQEQPRGAAGGTYGEAREDGRHSPVEGGLRP